MDKVSDSIHPTIEGNDKWEGIESNAEYGTNYHDVIEAAWDIFREIAYHACEYYTDNYLAYFPIVVF